MEEHLFVLCSKTALRLLDELSMKSRQSEVLQGIPTALKSPFVSLQSHKPPLKEKNNEKPRCLFLAKVMRTLSSSKSHHFNLDVKSSALDFVGAIS